MEWGGVSRFDDQYLGVMLTSLSLIILLFKLRISLIQFAN